MNPREHAAATLACGLAGEVVRTFGGVRLRVFGTSMVPAILPGDLISVQRAVVTEISSGDIVLYAREGRMFAHRVVGCMDGPEGSLLIVRGDRLRHNDPPVSSTELLGKVISIERGDRQVKIHSLPGGFSYGISRLLKASDRATYLYLRLASLWGRLAARPFSPWTKKSRPDSGANMQDARLAGAAAHKSDESPDGETFDERLRPMESQGAVKCQG
jgi:signal peptidase I